MCGIAETDFANSVEYGRKVILTANDTAGPFNVLVIDHVEHPSPN
jgi:hypothetical protein